MEMNEKSFELFNVFFFFFISQDSDSNTVLQVPGIITILVLSQSDIACRLGTLHSCCIGLEETKTVFQIVLCFLLVRKSPKLSKNEEGDEYGKKHPLKKYFLHTSIFANRYFLQAVI